MTRSSSPARHISEAVPFSASGGAYFGSASAANAPPEFTAATIESTAETQRPPRATLGEREKRTTYSTSNGFARLRPGLS
ncbi:hypothetical protein Aph02nite_38000 [Actinoplanes philippinensis]|nr:hypothetical protein Aph02nite_38000 [Actinoplanes philippinensis]